MTPIELARSYLGTKELKGSADNPKIMEMYRTVGHTQVEHDEVAWCAAFVGHCLEKAGLASTRKLNARSYLMWGEKVAGLEQAREGDVVIFSRGASTAQGHVAFFLKATGSQVEVLGGNQSDGVTIARYPRSRLLGIRRPLRTDTQPRPEMKVVQQQLKDLGYFEVGMVDGRYGPRTRAAVLAFRADNGLGLSPDVDPVLVEALQRAKPRAVSRERAEGTTNNGKVDVAETADAVAWTGVTGKPSSFTPAAHTHPTSEVTGLDAALAARAPLASPVFTGTPTAPTATAGTSSTQLATTAFVAAAVAALVNGSPGALDTLNELAAALGNDANFSATVTSSLAGKLAKASNLSDLTDAAAARMNLGLDSMALQSASAVAITGGSVDGVTLDGGTF